MRIYDLRKLRHVVEVARSGSFTTAAHSVHVSQSALTKSVASVEDQLGVDLFQRTPRGVTITDAGRIFVERAKQILNDVNELTESLKDYRELKSGCLKLGFAPAFYRTFCDPYILAMARDHPKLSVEVHTGSAEELVPKLMSGEIGVLFGNLDYLKQWPELNAERMFSLHLAMIARKDHPLTSHSHPTELDILQYPLIYPASVEPVFSSDIAEIYRRNNLPPRAPQYLCDDFQTVKGLILNTDAISPVLSPGLEFSSLDEKFLVLRNAIQAPPYAVAMATSRMRAPSAASAAFVQFVGSALGESDTADKLQRASS